MTGHARFIKRGLISNDLQRSFSWKAQKNHVQSLGDKKTMQLWEMKIRERERESLQRRTAKPFLSLGRSDHLFPGYLLLWNMESAVGLAVRTHAASSY